MIVDTALQNYNHICRFSDILENSAQKGLKWENTRSLQHFLFFSPREQKNAIRSLRRFLDPSDVFFTHFTPLQSLRVATSGAEGCYVLRFGHPKGDPGLRYGFRSPSLITLSSFVSKSLFKTRKISDLKGFFGDHPKKNCQFRDLYIKTRISGVDVLVFRI